MTTQSNDNDAKANKGEKATSSPAGKPKNTTPEHDTSRKAVRRGDEPDNRDTDQGDSAGDNIVDPFWLAKMYPNPVDIFAYQIPSPKTLAADCVFALDANVLLAPYQVSAEGVKSIEPIYKGLAEQERLFAPAQAVREYGKNRAKKVADVYGQVHQRLSSVPSISPLHSPMLEGIAEYDDLNKAVESVKTHLKTYRAKLAALKPILADWGWDDRVSELYRNVFTAAQIVHHDLTDDSIKEDLDRRYPYKLPPGYKDGNKSDEGVGDLIIWHSLLKLSRDKKKHLIFVCNEQKADWFVRSYKETLMPRSELRHEFFQATGKHFAIVSWSRFLTIMDAPATTIREAERAQAELLRIYLPIEERVRELLVAIDNILTVFVQEWAGDPEDTSYGGSPFVDDDRLESLIRSFQAIIPDYERLVAKPETLSFLKRVASLLGHIHDDNETIRFIEAKHDHSVTNETNRLVDRCRVFHDQIQQYHYWQSVDSGEMVKL